MRRAGLLLAVLPVFSECLSAQTSVVTIPAAASIVGQAPFFSDVRAFNTSHTSPLTVTATYQCFLGSCPSAAARVVFTLPPRDSEAFDDMIASAAPAGFGAPDSAGGIEFSFAGAVDQLVVTSRLYSTAPTPTVGMFIPGLPSSSAYADSVLTSIRNGGSGAGFRTNVGVFNPAIAPATVTFQVLEGGVPIGNPIAVTASAHSGTQVNGIFEAAGIGALASRNAAVIVTADRPVFAYAAVIDNATTDPYLVVAAPDQPTTPVETATPTRTATPFGTATPTPPGLTPTPTSTPPGGPTPTPGPTILVSVTSQGGTQFIDSISGTSTSMIPVGFTILWVWDSGTHSTTSGPCPPCSGDGLWDSGQGSDMTFSYTFTQPGTYPYFCTVHGSSMTGTVVVSP
jgi:hypothetical protein